MQGRLTEESYGDLQRGRFQWAIRDGLHAPVPGIRSRMGRPIAYAVAYMHAMIQAVYGS